MAKNNPRSNDEPEAAGVRPPSTTAARAVSLSALKEQADGLRRAQLMANLAHVITKPDGSFESWSETLPGLLGIKHEQIVTSTRRWLDLIHPADRELFRATALRARAEKRRAEVEYRMWRANTAWIYLRQVMEPIPGPADAEGRTRWFNTIQDITASKQAEQRIQRLSRIHAMLSGINSLIVRVRKRDDLYREACNIAVQHGGFHMAWLGLVEAEAGRVTPVAWGGDVGDYLSQVPLSIVEGSGDFGLAGRAIKTLTPIVSQDAQRESDRLKRAASARGVGSVATIPLVRNGKGVAVFAVYAAEVGHFDEQEMRLLLEFAGDVTFALEHLDKSERAEYLAYYDPLTELANRSLFYERLAQQLASASHSRGRCALLVIDIERFKTINDTFGRQGGDALLRKVAERMTALVPRLLVSRVGPDQFALVVPDVRELDELARRIEQRLTDFFGAAYPVGNAELRISAKLGIAVYPEDGADAETLFRNAEAALKKAKQAGEPYLFYEQRMSERVSEKLALESKLRRALEQEQFVLHYQPKVNLETRQITGAEALIRWQDPETGLVPPIQFIPLLEQTGLILPVGSWAIKRAALDQRMLLAEGLKAPRIAVNVSAIQLRHRKFVSLVEESIGGPEHGIDLEITESLLMDDIQANIEKLKQLRNLGIELAIDDFGTGYSSLAYLAKLPAQTLKIDRSFIKSMQDDADAMTLVSTMISLAHSMRLKVVAEGVETEEQARMLRLVRCDEMQGYLFSKPVPLAAFASLLKASPGS
jgi:diguanylate cyclase (GGDEF)-like protein/PAS domain S-box-containing protein